EEHILGGDSSSEFNRYTYLDAQRRAYFEYDISVWHVEGTKTEIRRYSGQGGPHGPLCRCLYREINVDAGEAPGPQFQMACDSEKVRRGDTGTWEVK
ncbi:MAG: hypothetical protein VX834_04755, partial [Myxococcota bacterium]|nr:hypothetical protein [Myxococcota bacterium]